MKRIFLNLLVFIIYGFFLLSLPVAVYAQDLGNNEAQTVSRNSDNNSEKENLSTGVKTFEIEKGLKAILRKGVEKAVAKLAVNDGFYKNDSMKIEMPKSLKNVKRVLEEVSSEDLLKAYVYSLNKSAEKASPKVGGYFIAAINQFTIKDPKKILEGGDSAATEYLKKRMSYGLSKVLRPVLINEMKLNGVYKRYDDIMNIYRRVPYEPNVRSRIEDYMVKTVMDAFFFYIAEEEKVIRNNLDDIKDDDIKKLFP